MKLNNIEKVCLTLLGLAGILVFGYAITNDKRIELKELELKKDFPSEYWIAEGKHHDASVKIKELDNIKALEISKRNKELELDRRDREAIEKDKVREFEKNDAQIKAAEENRKTVENSMYEQRRMQENLIRKLN